MTKNRKRKQAAHGDTGLSDSLCESFIVIKVRGFALFELILVPLLSAINPSVFVGWTSIFDN